MSLTDKRVGLVFSVIIVGAWVGLAAQPPSETAKPLEKPPAAVENTAEGNLREVPGNGISIPWAAGLHAERAAEEKIREALKQPFSDKFRDEPLQSVIGMLGRVAGVNVRIDAASLSENGLSPDHPVSDEFNQVPIAVALNWILRPNGLTWLVENEVLLVTTEESAENRLCTRVFPVSDALLKAKPPRGWERDHGSAFTKSGIETRWDRVASWLTYAVQEFTSGPWEEYEGQGGTLSHVGHTLIVRQTDRNLVEVEQFLHALEAAVEGKLKHGSQAVRPPYYPWKADEKVFEALQKPVSINVKDKLLEEFLAGLAQQFGITVRLNRDALFEEGIAPDEPISLSVDGVSLGSALRLALQPLDCTPLVEEGALKVTTEIDAEEHLFTVVYDVRDLEEAGYGYHHLIDTIQQETPGPWQETVGAGGDLSIPRAGVLIIRQTERNHATAELILKALREQLNRQETETAAIDEDEEQDRGRLVVESYDAGTAELAADLLATIPTFVHPNSWTEDTLVKKVGKVVVIRQTRAVHDDIEIFLDAIGVPPWIPPADAGPEGNLGGDAGLGGAGGVVPGGGVFSWPSRTRIRE